METHKKQCFILDLFLKIIMVQVVENETVSFQFKKATLNSPLPWNPSNYTY